MKAILLIMLGLSLSLYADFTRDGKKQIVTDNTTHLQWQDNADAKTVTKSWIDAINYCEDLSLGGYTDWRLPNINELIMIVDRSKFAPSIVTGFLNVVSDKYWSSTTPVHCCSGNYSTDKSWFVDFKEGGVEGGLKYEDNYYVRCVRDGE